VIHKLLDLKGDHPHAWFAMVENIHAFPADQIRKTVHSVGSPVKKDSSPNLEADNA
jgi:hypothetical protein